MLLLGLTYYNSPAQRHSGQQALRTCRAAEPLPQRRTGNLAAPGGEQAQGGCLRAHQCGHRWADESWLPAGPAQQTPHTNGSAQAGPLQRPLVHPQPHARALRLPTRAQPAKLSRRWHPLWPECPQCPGAGAGFHGMGGGTAWLQDRSTGAALVPRPGRSGRCKASATSKGAKAGWCPLEELRRPLQAARLGPECEQQNRPHAGAGGWARWPLADGQWGQARQSRPRLEEAGKSPFLSKSPSP